MTNDNLATSVDAYSASPAMRLRYRILAAKASVRPSQPVLPPALHPTGDYKNGAEYEPFSGDRKGTSRARTLADPIATLMRLRDEAAAEVERLLAFLDETEGDADLETSLGYCPFGEEDLEAEPEHDETTADDEPWLGFRNPVVIGGETLFHEMPWHHVSIDQSRPHGSGDDREVDDCDAEDGADLEPSLCGVSATANWHAGCVEDGEHDIGEEAEEDHDREPSLGWSNEIELA